MEHTWQRSGLIRELRAEMTRQELTQTTFAARLGRTQSWLSRRISGRYSMSIDDLEEICAALGVGVVELFQRAEK